MTIINAILLALASQQSDAMEHLDKLDELRDRLKKYGNSSI
jgi:hypothetical protein